MGKPEGKVAVITRGSSGLALERAKRFVEEGAYVLITVMPDCREGHAKLTSGSMQF